MFDGDRWTSAVAEIDATLMEAQRQDVALSTGLIVSLAGQGARWLEVCYRCPLRLARNSRHSGSWQRDCWWCRPPLRQHVDW